MLFDISFFYLQKYYFYQIICYIFAQIINNPIKISSYGKEKRV